MLNKEREKAIRNGLAAFKHWKLVSDNPASYQESHGPDMEDLLAEIDKLRVVLSVSYPAEKVDVELRELDQFREENQSLKAENERLQDNRATWKKDAGIWYEENQRLKERIEKLREVIQWAIGPTREVKTNGLIAALTEDDNEAEK